MARLLTAKADAEPQEFLQHVFVANIGTNQADGLRLKRKLESDIAHYRRHYRVVCQFVLGVQISRENPQAAIAIDEASVRVYKQRAIGVAIEGDAELCTLLYNFSLR